MKMSSSPLAVVLAVLLASPFLARGHPLCWYGPDRAVSTTAEATFCPNEEPEGFCCEPDEEAALKATFQAARVGPGCAAIYKEVCESFGAHRDTRHSPLHSPNLHHRHVVMRCMSEVCPLAARRTWSGYSRHRQY